MPVPAEFTALSPLSIWGAMNQFSARGGFVNGLNPTVVGKIWYVNGEMPLPALQAGGNVQGSDTNTGRTPSSPFATIARALQLIDNYDIIVLSGVFREQVVAPVGPYDVTIVGAANDPRQATNSGVATGGGASWLAPASPTATTPLIRVISQSWKFINLQMAPVAASACITFDRRETTAIPDSSHGAVLGCYFSGGGANGMGIEGIEVKKLRIQGNRFEALTGATGAGIKTTAGAGIAAPSHWLVTDNIFVQGVVDMNCLSLNFSYIRDNEFFSTNPIEGGTRITLVGSTGRNRVINNNFSDIAADVTIAKGYTPAANDVWRNWTSNTNVPIVTVPA